MEYTEATKMKVGLSRWQAKTKAKIISEKGVLKLNDVYSLIDEILGITQFDDCNGCVHSISTPETTRERLLQAKELLSNGLYGY